MAFELANPVKKPVIDSISLANGDAAVVEVTKVEQGQPDKANSDQRSTFQAQLQVSYAQLAYNFYVDSLMKNAKIEKGNN